jgi:tRNA A37 threonylcarbamoyladenosine synthetase subunit TsaC/SUA5/YrdC
VNDARQPSNTISQQGDDDMAILNPRADAARVLDELRKGNIAIVPHDVAYGVWGHTSRSIEEIYRVKGRSFAKANGTIGGIELSKEVHVLDARARQIIEAVCVDYGLAMAIVAPVRADHPFYRETEPLSFKRSTVNGTLELLLNAGPLHDELARLSLENSFPIMGSSANKSLAGSKFRLEDIEPEVRALASIEIYYGLCRYHNPKGMGSTIVNMTTWQIHREGACADQIRDIFRRHFRIELGFTPSPSNEH